MEPLHPEVAPFGTHTTIVNPGMVRTELFTPDSATYATPSIADYAERGMVQREGYAAQNGQQAGGSGEARAGTRHDSRPTASAIPLYRRHRCHGYR